MKTVKFISLVAFFLFGIISNEACSKTTKENNSPKIQVALLLDTSNSMDGLIDQAKSRLWDIVNTLTTLKFQGKAPQIEIALYEYGNDYLSESSGYIRQVMSFSNDLDLLSEKLFALRTNGGLEYCGAVIRESINRLTWTDGKSDMKLIYIAGNESFDQGKVSYKEAIRSAVSRDVYVNTIYCGNRKQGIRESWENGAELGKGKYFNIDSDRKVRYISTPYDDRISECNLKLNSTYIGYGVSGAEKQMNQVRQDENAKSISKENYAARTVSKSKQVYKNTSWDLVDYYEENNSLKDVKKSDLPKELQNKSEKEIEQMIQDKQKERKTIQKEIADLAVKRQEYIDKENANNKFSNDDLGKAINESVVVFAKIKGYQVN